MRLYLVRHAHAVTAEEAPNRPLSPRGRADTVRLAAFLRVNQAFTATQLWHSSLLRARETAQLLAAGLSTEPAIIETPGLLPEDDPLEFAARLETSPPECDLALVGHEPYLSALATTLARGRPWPIAFSVRKGAIIAFERTESRHRKSGFCRWLIRWHLSPELLPPSP